MKQLFVALILIFMSGCSTLPNEEQKRETLEGAIPQINLNQEPEEKIGPTIENGVSTKAVKRSEPLIGLIIGPSAKRSALLPCFFRELEKALLHPELIVAHDWSLIYSLLYAKGFSSGRQDWLLRDSLRVGDKVFLDIVAKEFEKDEIHKLKGAIFIPYFDQKTRSLIYLNKGPVVAPLMSALDGENMAFAPSTKEVFPAQMLRVYGADLVIGVNLLPSEINLSTPSGLLVNYYGKIYKRIEDELSRLDLLLDFNSPNSQIDKKMSLELLATEGCAAAKSNVEKLKSVIENWKRDQNLVELSE